MQNNEKYRQDNLKLLVQEIARALWLDDNPQIIVNLAKLAHCALESGHVGERQLIDNLDIGSSDDVMKLVLDTVMRCAAGNTESYAVLYGLCTHLTHKLLNSNNDLVVKNGREHDTGIVA
jgi:hypothetical protein